MLAAATAVLGCASKRPVLYPNATYEAVGKSGAEEDVADCLALAEGADLEDSRAGEVAKGTAASGAVGGAAGAASGAVVGRPGTGAAMGAAGAGAAAAMRGIFRSRDRDPLFKRYVETCLRERGYQVIGWK